METKRCSKCGKELPIDSFYKDRSSKDGLGFYCKTCVKSNKTSRRADTGGGIGPGIHEPGSGQVQTEGTYRGAESQRV